MTEYLLVTTCEGGGVYFSSQFQSVQSMVARLTIMVVECVEEILNLMIDKQTGRKERELGGRGQGQNMCPGLTPVPTS